jgi:hypothetical protein
MIKQVIFGFFVLSSFSVFSQDTVFLDEEGNPYILTQYDVDGDTISNPQNHKVPDELKKFVGNEEKNKEIWELFTNIIPFEIRKYVKQYQVSTDGMFGAGATVDRIKRSPTDWIINIDIQDAYIDNKLNLKLLTATLIHELGHILTLNTTQIDFEAFLYFNRDKAGDEIYDERLADSKDECSPNYFPMEGCTKADSYFNLFYQDFWADSFEEHQEYINDFIAEALIENPDLSNEDFAEVQGAAVDDVFIENSDDFVSPYSATNPGEDIAESWTHFILQDKPDASAEEISEKKILFFYQFPELVEYRQQIRDAINTKYANFAMFPWTPET